MNSKKQSPMKEWVRLQQAILDGVAEEERDNELPIHAIRFDGVEYVCSRCGYMPMNPEIDDTRHDKCIN